MLKFKHQTTSKQTTIGGRPLHRTQSLPAQNIEAGLRGLRSLDPTTRRSQTHPNLYSRPPDSGVDPLVVNQVMMQHPSPATAANTWTSDYINAEEQVSLARILADNKRAVELELRRYEADGQFEDVTNLIKFWEVCVLYWHI